MKRIEVVSKMFKSVGWDPETQILEVEFQPRKGELEGAVYQYESFSQDAWLEFRQQQSIGQWFLREIKPHYKATKIEPPKEEKADEANA